MVEEDGDGRREERERERNRKRNAAVTVATVGPVRFDRLGLRAGGKPFGPLVPARNTNRD